MADPAGTAPTAHSDADPTELALDELETMSGGFGGHIPSPDPYDPVYFQD